MSDHNPTTCNFLDPKNPVFKLLHHVLNNHSKNLLGDGVGVKKKQARVVTTQKKETLLEKGVMGRHIHLFPYRMQFFPIMGCISLSVVVLNKEI